MKLDRIEKIIKQMESNDITPYEVAQNTSLTQSGILKIKNRKSPNPRESSLTEIEDYLNARLNSDFLHEEGDINILAAKCFENWNELLKHPRFKREIDYLVTLEVIRLFYFL